MITYHDNVEQGSDKWRMMRCGVLTASEVKLILSPTLKIASNDKERQHVWEIASQRITQYVEPSYIGENITRGWEDELRAKALYSETRAPVTDCGFVTNDRFGFTIGYSPDGLVGDDGLIECKSRRQKYQVETIATNEVPVEYMFQLQTGLLVTERKWIDFVSYSGGLPMAVIRVEPIAEMQEAIIKAATFFEQRVTNAVAEYHATIATNNYPATERVVEMEIY